VQQRKLGDTTVGAIGLGCMPLSLPVERRPSRERALATLHAALDAGVTLIDTADAYCAGPDELGHNELLVAEAVRGRDDVLVATKGGHTRPSDEDWGLDGSPASLRRACEASLRRLGVEAIGLYQYHRPDPTVPWAETVGELEALRQEGKVRLVGVSNANVDQIREAAAITVLSAVQNEFSPAFRSSADELQLCAELGIAFLPWSPLGGIGRADGQPDAFVDIAAARQVSPQQVVLAWMLAQADVVIPIPGSSRPQSIRDSAAAAELVLTPEELARLDEASQTRP
jgi:aryl-alcohol dehydrogenase-like predicted oxidoreductase